MLTAAFLISMAEAYGILKNIYILLKLVKAWYNEKQILAALQGRLFF